jgi:hypothetical protein
MTKLLKKVFIMDKIVYSKNTVIWGILKIKIFFIF